MKISSVKTRFKTNMRRSKLNLSPRNLVKRYRENERGIAAIEFAVIAPVMIGMYFGLAEIASAISVDRRISHGTNVAGDLATQLAELKDGEIEEVVAAALRVMDIADVSNVSMDIESFILPEADEDPESRGRIRVNSVGGEFAQFDAEDLDEKLLNESSGVVVTRVRYEYTPLQLSFFDSTITLEETFLLKPRRSDAVVIQNGEDSVVSCRADHYSTVECEEI